MSAELLTTLLPLATDGGMFRSRTLELPVLVFQQLNANRQNYREVMKQL